MTREAPPPGTVLGERYRVIRQLGAGAFGSVLEVEHVHTRHHRAMKLLHPEAAQNPEVVERFLREASAAGRIGDPHIVETFDAGRFPDGAPYLVMEMLDGVTLRTLLHRERQLSQGLACELIAQAALGMHAAHAAGIIHRDLKPENLFVLAGPKVKILDFGVSRFSDPSDVSITQSNVAMGTPLYMPPEQFRGAKDLAPAADVYSLGVVLYELLSGSPPFHADTYGALAIQVSTTAPLPLSQRVQLPNPALEQVVAKAMAREVSDRFASAEAFAHALAPFRSTEDTSPLPRLSTASVMAAEPDEPTYRPPVKATPMATGGSSAPKTEPAPKPGVGRWLAIAVALALLAAAGFGISRRSAKAVVPASGPIAVLNSGAVDDWRSALAVELIQRQLSLSPGVTLVPLADAERFRRETRDWPETGGGAEQVAAARQRLGAGPVLLVHLAHRGDDIDVALQGYLSAGAKTPDVERSIPVVKEDVSDAALSLSHDLRAVLALAPPTSEDDASFAKAVPHQAIEQYAQGRRLLAEMNLRGAIASLQQADRTSVQKNPLVLDALTAAYEAAGFDQLALDTAEEAAKAATKGAPRSLALQIECRQRGLQRDVKALRLSCGALLAGESSLESRLLYATGLTRLEQWTELDGVLAGATAAEQQSPALLVLRARAAGLRLDFSREKEAGERLVEAGRGKQSPSIEAAGHFAVCEGERGLGQAAEAAKECDLALKQYYFVGDKIGQARAHTGLGHIAVESSGADGGSTVAGTPEEEYQQALTLAREAGSEKDEIASQLHLASLAMHAGKFTQAYEQLSDAEKHARTLGNADLASRTAVELGDADLGLERADAARQDYARAAVAANDVHIAGLEGFALFKAGRLEWELAELDAAQSSLERANKLMAESGSQGDRAYAAAALADVLSDRGDFDGARAHQSQARALWEASPQQQAWADADLLRYAYEAGKPVEAKEADELVARFKSGPTADPTGEAMALVLRAAADPAPDKWIEQAQRALASDPDADPETAAWVHLAAAELLARAGHKGDAKQQLMTDQVQKAGSKRVELWRVLLQARLSSNAKELERAAAEAKKLGYVALVARLTAPRER